MIVRRCTKCWISFARPGKSEMLVWNKVVANLCNSRSNSNGVKEGPVQIKNRQQILGVVAIAAVALFASDKLLISPLTRSWKERAARLVDLKKSVSQGKLLLDREAPIRERWESMRTNMLPSNLSVAESKVLKAFDRWSQEARLKISSIKPQWKRAGEEYMTLECRADAIGSMDALTRFLYEVEKDPLALRLEAIEITSHDNDG